MRKHQIHLRLTEDEKKAIQCHAIEHGMTVSKYLLSCALADEYAQVQLDRNALLELRKIGINLNQIAKELHSQKLTSQPQFQQLFDAIVKEGKLLDECRASLLRNQAEYKRELASYHADMLAYLQQQTEIARNIKLKRMELRKIRAERKRLHVYLKAVAQQTKP